MTRKCGACSECCRALEDDDRPAHTPCRHLRPNGRGCSHYHKRPKFCRAFGCYWLGGATAEADRPDRTGVLAHLTYNPLADDHAVNLVECRPDAFQRRGDLVEYYKRLDTCCLTLFYYDGRKGIYSRDRRYIELLREGNACMTGLLQHITVLEAMVE